METPEYKHPLPVQHARATDTVHITRWQQLAPPAEGKAVTFTYTEKIDCDDELPEHACKGFIICYQGAFRAYRNSCPHAGSPMDWLPGDFFSEDGTQLVCHTHDAHFDTATGDCLSGPCLHGLETLPLRNLRTDSIEVPAEVGANCF